MGWLDRLRGQGGARPPRAPEPEQAPRPPVIESHRSPALEEIVATARRRGGELSVLDLGVARPSIFAFLEPLARQFRIADLENALLAGVTDFSKLLPAPPEGGWDLVLVWDLLDRLDRPVAKRLAKRLEKELAPGALVHLLASRSSDIDMVAPLIQFADEHTLTIQRLDPGRRPGPGWTQRELSSWLAECEPGPSALHQTGFVEMVLTRGGSRKPAGA